MGSEEERVLEEQLELQLQEQRDSLSDIGQALLSDPTNPELLAVHEELVQAIKDAEEGLLHLKRARLLQEADSVLHCTNIFTEEEKVEPLDPADVEPEPLEEKCYSVGSKCRFRYKDGHWYNGQVVQLDNSVAKSSFLTPTSENMLMDPPPPPISLVHTRERTLEFLDDYDLSWDLCPMTQQVTHMGHLRTTEGPEDVPTRITLEHTTLRFKLPFDCMWAPPAVDPRIDSNSELVENNDRSTQGSVIPPRRPRGPRFRRTAHKSDLHRQRHCGETSIAAAAAVPAPVIPLAATVAPIVVVPPTAVATAPKLPFLPPRPVMRTREQARERVSMPDPCSRDFGGFHFSLPSGSDWDVRSEDLGDTSFDPSSLDLAGESPGKRPRVDW